MDNPLSFEYRVIYRVVKGFTFEMLLSGKITKPVEKDFIAGVKWLEQQGATGITGDCGYMFLFQSLARTHASVPVFMSSLCQLPLIEMAVESPGKVLILTSCGANFDKIKHVLPQSERTVVVGCEDVPGFDAIAKCKKVEESEIVPRVLELAQQAIAANDTIKAILIECTQLPCISDLLRDELQLPVFDIITCLDFFHASRACNPRTRFH